MTERERISVEPLSFGMTGFKVEDFFIKKFNDELKREFPTALIALFGIGFADSKDIIFVAYDRREGKYILERVDVEGTNAKVVKQLVEVLKRVLA